MTVGDMAPAPEPVGRGGGRRPRLVGLTIGDDPAAWSALGFTVKDDRFTVGGVTIHLVGAGEGRGILAWSLQPPVAEADGLAHREAPDPVAAAAHDNGVTGIDHVVAATPYVDRTTDALAAGGITPRRSVDGLRGGESTYRFFVLDTCVLELIGPTRHDPSRTPRPAAFAGLAFVAPDLDTITALPGIAGTPRDAMQPGRRIVTMRTAEHDVSVPLAVLTPR